MPYPPYFPGLPDPQQDESVPEWMRPGYQGPRPVMSESALASMLGLDVPQDAPEADVPDLGNPGFLERLGAATGGLQLGTPRDFGTGLLQGLVGGLGAQGRKIAATREKVAALDEARRKEADAARIQASRDYRNARAQAVAKSQERAYTERRDREKYERDNPPLTDKDIADNPWLTRAGLKAGDRPPDYVRKAVLETVTPETPREKLMRERTEASMTRQEAAAARAAAAAERATRLAELNSYDKLQANYVAEPAVKAYTGVRSNLTTAESAAKQKSGPGDVALIYSWHRALEPDKPNVVREGDVALTREAIGALQKYYAIPGRFFNGQQLTEMGRQNFLRQMRDALKAREGDYRAVNDQYRKNAERFGVDQDAFIRDVSPATQLRERGMQFVEP